MNTSSDKDGAERGAGAHVACVILAEVAVIDEPTLHHYPFRMRELCTITSFGGLVLQRKEKDAKGRTRMMMLLVAVDGKAEMQMLDEPGRIGKSISPGAKDGLT